MMKLSNMVQEIEESITLKLNSKAQEMADSGKKIYNLTAGQLPYRPLSEFTEQIRSELDFLKSFQYSPVPGFPDLREKLTNYIQSSRSLEEGIFKGTHSSIVGNGGKHVISNIFACLINPGDEVILLAPYWVSYPEMVKIYGGVTKIISSDIFDTFVPSLEEVEKSITDKTKLIIVNSPNNPSGKHYDEEWMKNFGKIMEKFPHVNILSDEIYFELNYFDPRPSYFYQFYPSLLNRTIIADGISKNLAATGLRLGFCVAPNELINGMSKFQGQTASGCNSLIQRALMGLDLSKVKDYLEPIKTHLRENSNVLREALQGAQLGTSWYQTNSAFYYLIDFSQSPVMKKYAKDDDGQDYSMELCRELLEKHGVALVPGIAFGAPNTARMSLVLQKEAFCEAVERIIQFLTLESGPES